MHHAYDRYFPEETRSELERELKDAELAASAVKEVLETASASTTDLVGRASAFVDAARLIEWATGAHEHYFDTFVNALGAVPARNMARALTHVDNQRKMMRHARHLERMKLGLLRRTYPASDVDPVRLYHALQGTTPPNLPGTASIPAVAQSPPVVEQA